VPLPVPLSIGLPEFSVPYFEFGFMAREESIGGNGIKSIDELIFL